MRILFVSSEVAPYAKTGGLADVSAALPYALSALGHDVIVMTPLYGTTKSEMGAFKQVIGSLGVPHSKSEQRVRVLTDPSADIPIYFIEHDCYFDRAGLYGDDGKDYKDNAERYGFFSRAVLSACQQLKFHPDIVHCNDWHTALIPSYVKYHPYFGAELPLTASILTVHNLAYQGQFNGREFGSTGLPGWLYAADGFEYYGRVNFLKGGILAADKLTTVSPSYAAEIVRPPYGCGLDAELRRRRRDLCGILNGIDTKIWNPKTDPHIARNYSMADPEGKRCCKRQLLKELGMTDDMEAPLIGFVSRLVEQKGLDIITAALPELKHLNVRLIVHGEGEEQYHTILARVGRDYPELVKIKIPYNDPFSHRMQAGTDMVLMPSRFEPCGLTPIYGLRYGSIPIVRETGGLRDSVQSYTPPTGEGNGFTFSKYDACALLEKIREAASLFVRRKHWQKLMKNAMQGEFSWRQSAARYVAVYEKATEAKARQGCGRWC